MAIPPVGPCTSGERSICHGLQRGQVDRQFGQHHPHRLPDRGRQVLERQHRALLEPDRPDHGRRRTTPASRTTPACSPCSTSRSPTPPSPAGTASTTMSSGGPITAIQLADTDGNPATDPDPSWTPLLDDPELPRVPLGPRDVQPGGGGGPPVRLRRQRPVHARFGRSSPACCTASRASPRPRTRRSSPGSTAASTSGRRARTDMTSGWRSATYAVANAALPPTLTRAGSDHTGTAGAGRPGRNCRASGFLEPLAAAVPTTADGLTFSRPAGPWPVR